VLAAIRTEVIFPVRRRRPRLLNGVNGDADLSEEFSWN